MALENNIYISFLISNLFVGIGTGVPWIQTLAEDTKSLSATNSVLALSTAYFGRLNRQQGIVNGGLELYGKALRNLNNDLQDPAKALSLTVLLCAMTLQIFEVFYISP